MRITQAVQKQTQEDSIDKCIDRVKHIKNNGITEENDALIVDLCLQYVILMSEIRDGG
tara:strand:- start:165 stop:338 length:174 start_codon:yes stop_codon:yes gene_type:complete